MAWEAWAFVVGAGIHLMLVGAAWGDLRARVGANRTLQDERHESNKGLLTEIRDDLKDVQGNVNRINGKVAEHEVKLGVRRPLQVRKRR